MGTKNTEALARRDYIKLTEVDYSTMQGKETAVNMFLALSSKGSGLHALGDDKTACRINWKRIYEPPT